MNLEKLEKLLNLYGENLQIAVEKCPGVYVWPKSELPTVYKKTCEYIKTKGIGSVDIKTMGWRLTTNTLGIKNTYTAIKKYLEV